jgi:hypothetical protein
MDLDKLVNQNKFFRRSVLVWAMTMSTYITLVTFTRIDTITMAGATVYGSGLTILTAVIGLYQFLRGKDDQLLGAKNENSARHRPPEGKTGGNGDTE